MNTDCNNKQEVTPTHLRWCKDRALEYVEQGDLTSAFASFISDMGKHESTSDHPALGLGMHLSMSGQLSTSSQMRDFIEGCN